jgi:hypothetical protein
MQVKENIKESDRCNCGRSPTGECIGCYFLTGAEFETRLAEYLAEQQDKNMQWEHDMQSIYKNLSLFFC